MVTILTEFLLSYEDPCAEEPRAALRRTIAHYSGTNPLPKKPSVRRTAAEIAADLEAKPLRGRSVKANRYEVFKASGFRCCACGASPSDGETVLHVDHIVPLNAGGSDELENMQALCGPCNVSKGDRHEDDLR